MILTITLMCTASMLAFLYLEHRYTYWRFRNVPSERPIPLLGNMKGMGSKYHFRDIHQRLYNQFKGKTPFAGMYMFLKHVAFIIDLDLVKQVLVKDFTFFRDRGVFSNVKDEPLTGHLFCLEGEAWRLMRQKLTPVFTSRKMKRMFGMVVEVGNQLAKAMDASVEAANDADGAVEIKEMCACYTTDVISSCAFGLECNSLNNPDAEFRAKGRLIFGKPRHCQLVTSFLFNNPKIASTLRFKVLHDEVSSFFMKAFKKTVEYRKKNGIKREDFMDQLIELQAKKEEEARQSDGIDLSKGLTIEQMAAQSFVFFVAGFETSSSTIAFCLYELALQPEIQQRLRDEIETVLTEVSNGELTDIALGKMQYLQQVLSETLRKHSIFSHLVRQANENYKVPNTPFVIEKGVTVLIPVHNIHHDPEIYPKPEKFDPSRFEPEAIKARHPYAYLPFGAGPRNCIGTRFGIMQSKIGIVSLIRKFRFDICKRTEVPLILNTRNFPLGSENGIYLKVERI